jgi:hypothetical protein
MSERYCKICTGWHDLDQPWPVECIPVRKDSRSHLPSPMFIADTMEPVKSMLDGKMYDSKRNLRKTYKEAGVIEVGNDPAMFRPRKRPPPDEKAIARSVDKAFSQAGLGA